MMAWRSTTLEGELQNMLCCRTGLRRLSLTFEHVVDLVVDLAHLEWFALNLVV